MRMWDDEKRVHSVLLSPHTYEYMQDVYAEDVVGAGWLVATAAGRSILWDGNFRRLHRVYALCGWHVWQIDNIDGIQARCGRRSATCTVRLRRRRGEFVHVWNQSLKGIYSPTSFKRCRCRRRYHCVAWKPKRLITKIGNTTKVEVFCLYCIFYEFQQQMFCKNLDQVGRDQEWF